MLAIDHVIWAAGDLEVASVQVEARFGLVSIPGGEHTGLGTANRIIPLGTSYVELLGVIDAAAAREGPLAPLLRRPDRLVGWMVRTDDLDAHAARLGVDPVPMARRTPDGRTLRWRLAGPTVLSSLPTFIEWDLATADHPGGGGAGSLDWLELAADPAELDDWLGPHDLPLRIVPADDPAGAGLRAAGITRPDGTPVVLTG